MTATINGTDISSYINESSYKMNQYDDYKEWVDGNRIKHHEIMRHFIKGSFDMIFLTELDLTTFLTLLGNNTVNGITTITLYVQNINQSNQYQVYFDMICDSDRSISTNYFFKKYKVTITER